MIALRTNARELVQVEFRVPAACGARTVWIVGEFNDWSDTANPMTLVGQEFVATICLQPGKTYRFRYLLDGERWENDWAAHEYTPNEFGGNDSVIDLRPYAAPIRSVIPDGSNPSASADQMRALRREPEASDR